MNDDVPGRIRGEGSEGEIRLVARASEANAEEARRERNFGKKKQRGPENWLWLPTHYTMQPCWLAASFGNDGWNDAFSVIEEGDRVIQVGRQRNDMCPLEAIRSVIDDVVTTLESFVSRIEYFFFFLRAEN